MRIATAPDGVHLQVVDQPKFVYVHRNFRVVDRVQRRDDPLLQTRVRVHGQWRAGGVSPLMAPASHRSAPAASAPSLVRPSPYSVDMGVVSSFRAACSVCQASVAHFTRTGNLRHVLERRQLAQPLLVRLRVELARQEIVKDGVQLLGLRPRLALERLRHDRRRRLGDGAAVALEGHVLDHVAVQQSTYTVTWSPHSGLWPSRCKLPSPRARKLRGDLACSRIMSLYSSRSSPVMRTPPGPCECRAPGRPPLRACCRRRTTPAPWPGTPKRSISGWRSGGRCGWPPLPGRAWCRCRAGGRLPATNEITRRLVAGRADEAQAGDLPTAPRWRRSAGRVRGRRRPPSPGPAGNRSPRPGR